MILLIALKTVFETTLKGGKMRSNPMLGPNDAIMQPSDVAGVVAFLCGPDSRFINGALIPVDGGYICK